MRSTITLIALALASLIATSSSAQTHDHFDRQRREAVARQEAARQHASNSRFTGSHFDVPRHNPGHWGGPTTTHRYYPSTRGHIHQQQIQFYPVNPFGYGFPGYGYYGGYGSYCGPGYGAGSGIYIHREIYHSR